MEPLGKPRVRKVLGRRSLCHGIDGTGVIGTLNSLDPTFATFGLTVFTVYIGLSRHKLLGISRGVPD